MVRIGTLGTAPGLVDSFQAASVKSL